MNTLATVVTLTGRAWAVAADGQRRELQVGDRLRGDEMLVTEPGARVDLDFGNNQVLTFLGEQQQPVAEVAAAIQAELPPSAPRQAAEDRQQTQSAPASGEPEGHNFVQLVRINEIIEADGITPLTVARIQELLRPLGMSLPERVYDLDEWREHRGGDERYEDAPAARHPGLTVELQGAGPDGIYSEAEIGPDGTVPAEVTLDDKVRVGDRLVITDGKGNTLLDRPVTQDDLDNGVTVEVPVAPGDRNVTVEATVTTPRGYTGRDRDDKPVDNLPPDEVTILPPQDSEDAEPINLDLGSYFEDNVDGKDLTYDVIGLPPGLSFDPDTGIITGTIDRSASQGGPDDDGIYKVTVTITDKVGNQTTIDFDWTVTNPEPEARDDRQTIDEDTVATGNVLTGAGNDPGVDGSDSDPDGDDLTVTSFTIGSDSTVYPADGTPVSVEDADGNVIGEITLNENGDYSFTPVPDWNGSVPDIHYTISDGEGGEDEARLSITVAPVNDPVELENIPDPNDPNDPGYPAVNDPTDPNDPARGNANDHVVFESALPGGSDQSPNQADLKVESSFTINAPDGLHGSQGLVLTYTNINGESRTLNLGKEQIEQLGSNNQTVDTQYGKLVLNGYTLNADGTISIDYEYTLERASEVGGDHVDDRINIAVRDSDAHHPSDTDSKDLVIRIIDDAPVARDDANSIDEDTAVPVTGNVIANGSTGDVADTQGADGATVTGVTAGDQTAGGHVADGGVAGNIVGDYGTLVLNADGSYSYQLDNSNLVVQGLHPDDAPLTDTFTYTITDADGDQSTATLTITVNGANDGVTVTVPDPNDPTEYPVVNDPADPNDPARGKVNDHVVFESGLSGGSATDAADTRVVSSFTLSALDGLDDTAAITFAVNGLADIILSKAGVEALNTHSQSITTEYGELVLNGYTLNADGSITIDYEYTLTSAPDNTGGNGDSTDDTIRITVNDRDTDSDSQDLVIRIIDDAPVARDDTNQVDEDVLSVDGNVITSSVAGEEDTVGADGATVTGVTTGDQTAGGHVADGNVGTVISGQYGDLTLNADGSYSYQLDNSNLVVQGLTDGDTLTETFTYTITDADGDQSTATLTITVNGTDDGVTVDVPVNDGATTPDGNVNDHVVFESGLTNGSAPNPNDLKIESRFTLVALDGLATSGAVELTFANTNGNTQTLSLSKEQVEQLGSTPVTLLTQYGELVLNGYDQAADGTITIEYEYTLQRAPEVDAVDVRDAIGIKVTDRDGDQDDSQSISIKIVDDAPIARDDTNQITEDAVSVDGNVIASGVAGEEDTVGADGAEVTGVVAGDETANGHVADGGVSGNIVGDYGTLVLNADGSYTYELDNSNLDVQGLHPDDAPLTDVFTYTITDADGDQSTATITITVNGANDGVTVTVPDPNDPTEYPVVNDPADPNDPARGKVNDHVVFESGLSGGSATDAADTRVVSSFTLSALDGLDDTAAITFAVNGLADIILSKAGVEALNTHSQSITTEYGELVLNGYTLNADGSITIDYEYTLTSAPDNTGGNGVHTDDTIRITVNDRDTDSDSQDLVIRIIDDAPVARDDANEIDEDEASVTGNVITGGSTDDVADTEGADGAEVTAIVSDNDSTSTATTNADGDLVIVGEFGTLTISPDGSYTYALNNDNAEVNALKTGETLVDEFTYTLTDIDGDSDTATLTITINGNTDGAPTIVPEDVNGPDVPTDITTEGHVTVHERGLTGADSSHVNDGSVTITAPDGLQSITVGGVPVDLAQLAALDPADPATHIEIDTPQGKLTLTGFDVTDSVGGVPTEGELQFTYELEQVQNTPADPTDPDAGRNSTETIPLEVTDAGGETGTGDLVINIIDDVPVAVDDTNVITEDQLSVTGNVIGGPSASTGDAADTKGADGATVTEVSNAATGSNMTTLSNGDLVIEGQYGTLTIRPDGFYTYELDNSNPDVNALKGSSTPLQDVFTYTLTDGDGDSDSADLTITINGNTDGAPTIVPEDVNGPDVPADITTQGHVTVHERGLTGADSSHINDGSVTITAADGLQSITVGGVPVDLAQLAALDPNDPATHIEIDTPQGKLTLTGFDVTDSVGGVPTEGELQFTYELEEVQTTPADPADPDAGRNSTETISLEVTDAGGETGTGDLVINIIDDVPVARDDAHSIDEDETSVTGNVITGGSTGDVADTEGADGAEVTGVIAGAHTSGHVADGGVGVSVTGQYGSLTLNDDGSYSYELDNSNLAVQGLGDGESLTETFSYTITDADGDQSTATLTITVNGTDDGVTVDVPVNDSATTPDGNVNDHVVFESGLPNGSATNPDDLKVESSFTLVALDGLATSGAVELTFTNTNGNTQTLSLSKEQVEQLDSNPATLLTQYGELVLNGYDQAVDGTITIDYEYTLQRAPEVDAVDVRDAIGIKVTDRDGDQDDSQSISIKIVDDAPQAADDTNTIAEDELSVTGNVRSNDQQGADGAEVTDIASDNASGNSATTLANGDLVIEGQYGTLTISPDGSYTYELDNTNLDVQSLHPNDVPLEEVFSYTLTDGDNDSDTAQLTISITGSNDGVTITVPDPTDPADPNYPVVDPADPNDPARGNVNDHVVFESGLSGGSATDVADTRVVSSFTLSALDGLDDTTAITIEVAGNTLTLSKAEVEALGTTSQSITTEYGELVLNGYTPNADGSITIDYEYTLTSAPDNTGGNGDSTDERISITVNDRDIDSDSQDLVIRIIDDAPVARDDANEIDEDELSVIGNVITGGSTDDVADTEGADGATVTVIVSDNDSTSSATTNADGDLVIVGEFGTLTISPNGSYTYELNNDNAEVNALKDGETLVDEFSYTLTDADGDSDTATLTITINGNTDGTPTIVPEDGNGDDPNDFLTNGHATVYERGLMSGDTSGSHITDGSIIITAPDGLGSLVVGGTPVSLAELEALDPSDATTHIEIDTPEGKLVLTGFDVTDAVGGVPTEGSLHFSYELEEVQNTPADPADPTVGRNNSEQIPLTVIDAGGDEADGTLIINIIDDTPTAVADTGNVTEGDTLTVDAANGVLANDTAGADGWADTGAVVGVAAGDTNATSSGGVGGRIDGQYGYLILNADGSYDYVSTANAVAAPGAVDVFTYTVRDADGDLSHTTLTINVADVTLTPVTTPDSVNESGLVGGSSEGDNSHTTSGQVALPPGLEVVPGSGTTTHGTFTIDQDGNYTYTLTGNTNGDNTSDSFTYVSRDANGNTVTNTVTIEIVDDQPVARDDANRINEDAVSVSGNVIGGGSASDDDVADSEGADGAAVTDIASDNVAGNNATTLPNGDRVIEGEYGTLTIRPDGFYTYELNNDHPDVNALKDGDELEEVFTYTLTDGDGDTDSADLTITINGRTDGVPGLSITDHNGLDVGHNTIAEDATAPVTGEFTISAPDGLKDITVGTVTITADELANLGTAPVDILGLEGILTLTGYDPDTGKVTYEYQQSGTSKDHTAGDDSVTDSFPIIVTDKGGDSSAASDLVILITDTAPVANPDTGSIDEDGSALEGNVLAGSSTNPDDVADDLGADTTTVTAVSSNNEPGNAATSTGGVLEIEGEYGTLTIRPDGSYTYELHDSAKVNALKDGDVRQEVFEYTITDSDGDADSTTLTITINGRTDGSPSIVPNDENGGAIDGHITVHESGLRDPADADDSNIAGGSIQISAADGLASISIGGQSFTLAELQDLSTNPSAAIPVEGGTLVLTGFTPGTDVGGVPTSGTLEYTYTLTGERTHGSAGNDDVLLNIPLSVTDAGNETANGTLTVQVVDDVPTAVADSGNVTEGDTLTVDAANGVLANDTAGADGWTGTGAVVGVAAGDTNATSSGGVGGRIDGQYGYLILNADGSYEYVSTADAVTGNEVDVFTYTVRDGDGDLAHTTLTINVADVTLAPETTVDSVNESGLSGGTTEGDNSHITSGQVNLPPGLEVVPGSGTTAHGTFTIDQDGNYTYTLTGNTSGDNTSDSFTYVTQDANGNTVENTVTINIVDDQPVAVDDVNSIPAGSYVVVTGELINGGLGGAGQDSVGADGAAVTEVVNTAAGTLVAVPTDGTSTTINGQYGVLTIEADGSYSYQRNPGTPGDVQDVFTYTITDGDGDTDEATLTIDIGDATPTISGLTPSVNGGELTFEEKHLADGSAPDSTQLTKAGDFTISSPDGIGSLTIGGVTVITNGALTGTTTVTTPQGHTLEITGYDPATGRVTYEYTLTDREDHDQSTSDTELFDDIPVVLTDRDGDSVNDTLSVRIVDDVPEARDDTNSITEDDLSVTGNVIDGDPDGGTADDKGADGATITDISSTSGNPVDDSDPSGVLVIEGEYGILTIEPDGSYTYELNNDSADVNALKDGETLVDEFTYTLTDSDGDSDTAKLTITINGRTDGSPSITPDDDNGNGAIDGHNTANESGLAGGSTAGDGSNSVDGSIQISAGDGLASISIGGQSFTLAELQALSAGSPSAAIAVDGGTLVLTGFTGSDLVGGVPTSGTLEYTYTLTGERTHSGSEDQSLLLDIPLSVTDAGNETVNGTLTIQVVDDVPSAVDDTADVAAGEFELVQNGNVLSNDTEGADGARVTSVTPDNGTETAVPGTGNLVIEGDYGRLTIHSDGSYSYQRNPGTPGGVQDVFSYTITDGDGDTSSASLTISIADSAPTVDIPSAGSATTTVHESGLPDGSDNIPDRATTSGSIEFNSADGLGTVSLGGHTLTETDQTFPTTGPAGSLTARYEYDPVTGKGSIHYSYTLAETTDGDNTSVSFPVAITDRDGDAASSGNLVINIVDDTPTAAPDQATVTEGATLTVDAANGVLENDAAGADGWHDSGNAVVDVASNNQPSNTASTVGGALVIEGEHGTLTLNADGSYTYESRANAVTGDEQDVFIYTVRDADGDETTATLTINISDVTGIPRDTAGTVDEAGLPAGSDASSDKETTGGSLNLADGWTVDSSSVGNQSSGIGTLTINVDGSYSYELTSRTEDVTGVEETDTFTYTAKDQYGNTVTNTVTITIIDDVPSVTLTGNALGEVQVDETTLGYSALADFSGAFTHHFGADGDGGLVYTLEVNTAATGLLDTETGDPIVLVASPDGLTVTGHVGDDSGPAAFTISVDANGEVTLTQSRPLQHTDPNNHDDVLTLPAGSLKLTGTVTDGDGDTDSASVDIGGRFSFRDDGPTIGAAPAPGVVDEAYLTTGSGDGTAGLSTETSADLDVDFGADGQGSLVFSDDQVALRNWLDASGNTDITITGTGTSVLSGTRGGQEVFTVTLTVDASGQASYHFELKGALLHRSHTQDHELTFSYAAVDGDGDRANGTFRVDVKDDEPRSEITIDVNEDDANGPFTTSADATQDNTTISITDGGPALPGTPNGNDLDYDVGRGTVTVHEDGRITYTPNPDYSNHGSPDEFYVTVTEDDGTSQTIKVTVNVIPVADAPELTVDSNSVTTNEDEVIGLGLNAPQVTDNNDQSPGEVGDSPELLGLITLSGIPAGAALLDGTAGNAELLESTGGDITILLSDGPHLSDLLANPPAGTLVMTTAQYEALQVLPPAESHANFTVGVRVTSYEVDEAGERLAGIDGAESAASVTVRVQAVTDPVELTFDDDTDSRTLTINEDTTYNLKDLLVVDYPDDDGNGGPDIDGSEERWFEISGLPTGSVVNGTTVTGPTHVVRVSAPDLSTSDDNLPDINITPPADFSGDINDISVTLKAQDRDGDGPNDRGVVEESSVTLNLRVNPMAGDVNESSSHTIVEDNSVAFLSGISVTDDSSDSTGGEVITQVEFTLPTDANGDWSLTGQPADPSGWNMTGTGTGPYVIIFDGSLTQAQREDLLGQFEVTPPAHSSLDAEDWVIKVTTVDSQEVGGTTVTSAPVITDHTVNITVTPVAERTDTDSDGQNGNDVTLTPGRDYNRAGEEDVWFLLGTDDAGNGKSAFNLKDGWSNEDGAGEENGGTAGSGSEETFALLTPRLIAGDGSDSTAIGSQFQYYNGSQWVVETFGGDPIEVPMEYLDTLQFKAAPHFSGMFEIEVQVKTVDYDEDHPGDEGRADVQISGNATLTNVLIAPKADTVTATVTARVEGDEDERMPLSIRPKSSDPSESFEVDIDGIPDGATLWYDGVELKSDTDTSAWPNISITDHGDGTWKVEFTDFDPSKGGAMGIRAPQDSNEPFDLDIAIRSVDELHIPNPGGTPDPIIHRDVSSDYPLTITVAPKGIADEAIIDLIDYDDPVTGVDPFTEADVDAAGGVMLSGLIVNAQLKDNDGSETLTFKISGLPDGFSIEGATFMGGSGTDREWSLTEAQLAGARLVTPPNFNGSQTFDFYSVTTEDDNDSLTEQHSVELRVSPSPEATINLEASIDEDVSTRLDFSIQHRNGDVDEVLEEVWISAADLAALGDLNLTYGQNGPSLADAAADAGNTSVVLDNGWYKLTGAAIDNVYAQGRENWHGDASFGVHYVIRDPALDSSVSDVSEGFDGTYEVVVNPITDQVTLVDPADISLSSPGNTGITLNIGNTGADYDGSEQLTRIILEDVPEGVVVVGTADYDVDYVGDGTWVLIPTDGSFNGVLTPSIALQVHGRAGGLDDHQIRVTVVTEDANNGVESRASTEVGLTTNFAEGDPEAPATIERWEQTSFEPTEDVAFNLGQAIDAEIDATGVTNSGFTITLTDLPPGTQVTGMTRTMVNGEEVWSVSGQGGDAELQSLLSSITVTPPLDWNSNKGPFEYNATLTTHTPSGGRAQESIRVEQEVIPVTDNAAISIDMPAVDEGNDLAISINISNPSDDPDWELIDGNLYLELDESGMSAGGGTLLDASGNPLIQAPDGRYVIENVTPGTPINLTYVPSGPYVSGSISLEASVTGQENGAASSLETTVSRQGDVNPVNNGYDFEVSTSDGNEAPVAADKEHAIRLNITDNGLEDDDGSESITAILLKNLPNDFLVFVGEDAASATLAEMANNAGGSGTNTWLLEPGADGNLPPYIAILPPKNWSGTLENLELTVISGEGNRSDSATDTRTFNLEVSPLANGLAINPTPSFGREGEIIGLNLNARFDDLRQAGTTDESVERATVELKGLGEHAGIYVGGNLIMDRVTYDEVNDVYTITGLTQDEIDQLGFVQAAGDINNLQVRARTEEYDASTGEPVAGVEPSDWTHGTDDDWDGAAVTTNISTQFGTSGADELLWTGQGILNGRGGDDTVQLRFGESLEGSDLAAHLRNIEVIDLGIEGENQIEGLRVDDVLAMTDGRDTLKIFGDSDDSVSLDDPGAWSHLGQQTEGDKTFNVYEGGGATLWVEQGVQGITID